MTVSFCFNWSLGIAEPNFLVLIIRTHIYGWFISILIIITILEYKTIITYNRKTKQLMVPKSSNNLLGIN